MTRILVVDDDHDHLQVIGDILEESGFQVSRAASAEEALGRVKELDPSLIITDFKMPGLDGVQLMERVRESMAEVDVIVMTGHEDMTSAVSAMKAGAFEYVVKPIRPGDLRDLVGRCLREQELARSLSQERPEVDEGGAGALVGRDPRMIEIYKMIGVLSRNRATVMVRGETGTGKEVVARAIHEHSAHSEEPFIAVNCTALSDTLLESELFGHVKGAFTGAVSGRKGYFELAGSGSIFLDEIGDTSPDFQTKLLRVLQDRTFFPVGGEAPRTTDARVIAATHQPIEEMVEEGGFRSDLYYRLKVVEISVPPLRERRGDIPILADTLLEKIRKETGQKGGRVLASDALAALESHDWPGNVRELENALTRATILARGTTLTAEHLALSTDSSEGAWVDGDDATSVAGAAEGSLSDGDLTLNRAIAAHVRRVLRETGGNKSQAARLLGISRSRLARLVEKNDLGTD